MRRKPLPFGTSPRGEEMNGKDRVLEITQRSGRSEMSLPEITD